jgi:hypothetical protein
LNSAGSAEAVEPQEASATTLAELADVVKN